MVLPSRYHDNIYLLLLIVGKDLIHTMVTFLSSLLHAICGIKLKWEKHDGKAVWGEGCLSNKSNSLCLHRKGATLSLDFPSNFEWDKWVDSFSPTRMVWRSHSLSLLLKSLWCALRQSDILETLCSLMWGIGYKGYGVQWWLPIPKRFYHQQGLFRLLALPTLWVCVKGGKLKACYRNLFRC